VRGEQGSGVKKLSRKTVNESPIALKFGRGKRVVGEVLEVAYRP